MDLTRFHYYTDENGRLHAVDLTTGDDTFAEAEQQAVSLSHKSKYNKQIAIAICEKVREGLTLAQIANMPDMPPLSLIYQWSRAIEEFSLQLDYAREDRAHHFHDKVIEEVEQLDDPAMVNVVKTKVAAYQWAAEKANKRYYGKEKGEEGGGNVTIIVSTGIPDSPATPVTVEAACKTVTAE